MLADAAVLYLTWRALREGRPIVPILLGARSCRDRAEISPRSHRSCPPGPVIARHDPAHTRSCAYLAAISGPISADLRSDGRGYVFGDVAADIEQLDERLEPGTRSALHGMLKLHNTTFDVMKVRAVETPDSVTAWIVAHPARRVSPQLELIEALPNLIAVSWQPEGGDNLREAVCAKVTGSWDSAHCDGPEAEPEGAPCCCTGGLAYQVGGAAQAEHVGRRNRVGVRHQAHGGHGRSCRSGERHTGGGVKPSSRQTGHCTTAAGNSTHPRAYKSRRAAAASARRRKALATASKRRRKALACHLAPGQVQQADTAAHRVRRRAQKCIPSHHFVNCRCAPIVDLNRSCPVCDQVRAVLRALPR